MLQAPITAPAKESPDPHLELTQAHREAARATALLREYLAPLFQINVPHTQKQAIKIGCALEKVASAERACGSCAGENHAFAKAYQDMLENHRLAYIDFERLSRELENKVPPRCSDVARLVADIECHINWAEQAHLASILATHLKNPSKQP